MTDFKVGDVVAFYGGPLVVDQLINQWVIQESLRIGIVEFKEKVFYSRDNPDLWRWEVGLRDANGEEYRGDGSRIRHATPEEKEEFYRMQEEVKKPEYKVGDEVLVRARINYKDNDIDAPQIYDLFIPDCVISNNRIWATQESIHSLAPKEAATEVSVDGQMTIAKNKRLAECRIKPTEGYVKNILPTQEFLLSEGDKVELDFDFHKEGNARRHNPINNDIDADLAEIVGFLRGLKYGKKSKVNDYLQCLRTVRSGLEIFMREAE